MTYWTRSCAWVLQQPSSTNLLQDPNAGYAAQAEIVGEHPVDGVVSVEVEEDRDQIGMRCLASECLKEPSQKRTRRRSHFVPAGAISPEAHLTGSEQYELTGANLS